MRIPEKDKCTDLHLQNFKDGKYFEIYDWVGHSARRFCMVYCTLNVLDLDAEKFMIGYMNYKNY
jgi:hypothetical protein